MAVLRKRSPARLTGRCLRGIILWKRAPGSMGLIHSVEKLGKPFWTLLGLAFLVLVGLADYYLLPYGMSVALFYVFPIALVTWLADAKTGTMIAIASAFIWYINDILVGPPNPHRIILVWNASVRLFFFTLTVFAIHVGKAYEHERAVANTDFLTGALNRRSFAVLAQRELDRLERYGHPFTVAYLDLDNFKFINDSFGHSTGNRCLQVIVSTMKTHLRKADMLARMGGDEFAVLLPETEEEAAKMVLFKVRNLLLDEMRKNDWPITLSIGVLTFIKTPSSIDEMLRMVDLEMYSVKRKGKNGISYSVFTG